MSKAYFITATDTGIGKTFITAGLATVSLERGLLAGVMKPVSSGGMDDARFFKKKLKLECSIGTINPIRFKQPLSPYSASKTEKTTLDLIKIKDTIEKLALTCDILFVEGIGGALVPLRKDMYVADLIYDLKMPAIVIARAGLGTLNHTLMTVEALRKRRVNIAGIIMNGFTGKEISEKTNEKVIEELSHEKVIGRIRAKSSFNELVSQIKSQKILDELL